MGLFCQPIAGVKVGSSEGFVVFPGFDLVDNKKLLEYLANYRGQTQEELWNSTTLDAEESETYIVVSRSSIEDSQKEHESLAQESIHCASVLSIALWLHSDLQYTVQLLHEAYFVRGNVSLYMPTVGKSVSTKTESGTRGLMVKTYHEPCTLTQDLANKICNHPLLKALFDICAASDRTPLQISVHSSCRHLYYGYSAHFSEAQLIGATCAIDALVSTTECERKELRKQLNGKKVDQRHFIPSHLIKPMLGLANLKKVVEFDSQEPTDKSIFKTYKVRNAIIHNGATCTYTDACNGFRLAIRVLLCVADACATYQTRIEIVSRLLTTFDQHSQSGGALTASSQAEYPWFDNGMPDFLPLVISRFFADEAGEHRIATPESLAKACLVIVQQRGVTFKQAYSTLFQSEFFTENVPALESVLTQCNAPTDRSTVLGHAASCRLHSPLAWRER